MMKLENFSSDKVAELRAWVHLWLMEATVAGLAAPPFSFDDATLQRALALHDFGLDPVDAAMSMFGTLH